MDSQEKQLPQSLYCNQDHYWLVINAYLKHSNQYEIFAKWIEDKFESSIVDLLCERFGDQELSVCGIGSSTGYKEILQMMKLKSKFPHISAIVIEPNSEHISKYRDTVLQENHQFAGIHYEWHNQTFQEYMKSKGSGKKFHFITVVLAIYYMGEVEEVVQNLYDLLKPGGLIFVVLVTEHTGLAKFAKTFPDLALERRELNRKNTKSLVMKTNCLTNSADVKSVLEKYNMMYSRSSFTESADLTPCFTEEDTTEAKLLFDLVTATKNFKESVSEEVFEKVMQFLKDNTRVMKSDQGAPSVFFDTECDVLMISK